MIVAVTGVVLILFVFGHLLGNLQIFLGPAWINGYAEHLRELGPFLWIIRGLLLIAVLAHIYYTVRLAIENRRARPQNYRRKDVVKASFASRHMVMSGVIILAFIVFHLLQFSFRTTDPRYATLAMDPLGHYDVYGMMVLGFTSPLVSGFYIFAMFLLCLHLSHGSQSFFQSLGLNNQKLAPRLILAGRVFAWLLFIGYSSIPAAVLLGLVKPS